MPKPQTTSSGFEAVFTRIVNAASEARATRACLLTTRDREHAERLLKETVTTLGRPLYRFTVADRVRYNPDDLCWQMVGSNAANLDPAEPLRHASEMHGGGIVIMEDFASFLRDDGGDRRMRMLLTQMLGNHNTTEGLVLVFLEPPESERYLPSILADQFVRLDVRYPRVEELKSIAREEIALSSHRKAALLAVETIREQADLLAPSLVGLTRSAARDALRDAMAAKSFDFDSASGFLEWRKTEQLRRELAMNVLNTDEVEVPVGLENLFRFLEVQKAKMTVCGPGRARGVLLVGPPGTGKTMLAKSVGKLVGLPVVEFRLSALMNSYLGETERRFAQAFATLEAMSPNVVFIDEMEKAFGDSSERDGGTMMRCTGSLLSWLSDNPYPNFVVGTCNSLTRMGEIGLTMTRSERFDAAFFVDVPGMKARCRMLEHWLAAHMNGASEVAVELAKATDKFSGADLRSLVKQAVAHAEFSCTPLTMEILQEEVSRKRMRAIALHDEFQDLRRWGNLYCEPASLPEE